MTRKNREVLISGLIVLGVIGAMTLAVGLALLSPPAVQAALIRGTMVLLAIFLAVLVTRYLVLMWLGYLHHLERASEEAEDPGDFLPPVSVLVPAYNEGPNIEASVRSLLRQDYPEFEVIVVDDGSTDDTFDRASRLAGEWKTRSVRVVSQENGGKASALNRGMELSRHPFVVCVDGDTRLSANALRAGTRHFRDPRVGAVAGNVKVVNRLNLWARLQALEYIQGLNTTRRAQGYVWAVNIVPGPIGFFRKDLLMRLGGYETDTFAEDADITLKILMHGWRLEYEDRAIAYTEAPERLLDLIKQRYRWTRGTLQALRKRSHALTAPDSVTTWLSVCLMFFESILWPVMTVIGGLFFIIVAVAFGAYQHLVAWWLLLTVLDLAAAVYTVAIEEEELGLVPFAIIYRFFFMFLVDVWKLFATCEELMNLEMSWGKLERLGRIG